MEGQATTPPHSPEAERGLLGSILLDTQTGDDTRVLDLALAKGIVPESFFDTRHRILYDTLCDMSRSSTPIDELSITERLRSLGRLDAVGGVAAIQALVDDTSTSAHAEYWTDVVRRNHLLRRMVDTAQGTVRKCFEQGAAENADILLGEAEKDFLEIGGGTSVRTDWRTAVERTLASVEKAFDGGTGVFNGLSTGFKDLDRTVQGLKPSEMIVIAARPSVGKTSLAMNIAECVATGQDINGVPNRLDGGKKHPVLIFSLEMDVESLSMRMLCGRAGVNIRDLRRGYMTKDQRIEASDRVQSAAGVLRDAPIYIDDQSGLDIMDMRARARRMHRQHGIELIVIDYLQLCNCREYSKQGRQLETSRISNQVKAMAKELKIPVIVLSQLSRANEQRGDKQEKPKLSDLRDSGAIEQDADVVFLLRRPCRTKTDPEAAKLNLAIVDVAKHRNGEIGEVRMNFYGTGTRFGDRDKSEDADLYQNEGGPRNAAEAEAAEGAVSDSELAAQAPAKPKTEYVTDPFL